MSLVNTILCPPHSAGQAWNRFLILACNHLRLHLLCDCVNQSSICMPFYLRESLHIWAQVLQIDIFQRTCALVGRDFGDDEVGIEADVHTSFRFELAGLEGKISRHCSK